MSTFENLENAQTTTETQTLPVIAYCRACGKGLTAETRREARGIVYCEEHVPSAPEPAAANPYVQPTAARTTDPTAASPVFAALLGTIPGVGAIYNGQYVKGLVHALIFGAFITIIDGAGTAAPMIGIMMSAFYFYMIVEAYHTARKRQAGERVEEFSSLIQFRGGSSEGFPAGAIVLIVLGVVFLLNSLDILRLRDVLRFWPVALIGLGAYMLVNRVTAGRGQN